MFSVSLLTLSALLTSLAFCRVFHFLFLRWQKREKQVSALNFYCVYFLPASVPAETRQSREGAWKCPPGSWCLVTDVNCDHHTCWKQIRLSNLRPKDTGHYEHTWGYWTLSNLHPKDTGHYEYEHTWGYWTIWAHMTILDNSIIRKKKKRILDNMSTHKDAGQYEHTWGY